ncbi:MAG: DinB family protein [Agriterribacter sp.]
MQSTKNRRAFLSTTLAAAAGCATISFIPVAGLSTDFLPDEGENIIGPRKGYSPQIGTLVSMMNWMRTTVLYSVKDMKQADLDYLHDEKSNTIGAMLMHLAATETFYQANTFEGRSDYNDTEKQKWESAMNLGDAGRKDIKGHELDYYLDILKQTREKTLAEFRKRDDKWLMTIDPKFFGEQPTNNYCKWFHVCEHESNHNGQIKWLKGRLPGASHKSE